MARSYETPIQNIANRIGVCHAVNKLEDQVGRMVRDTNDNMSDGEKAALSQLLGHFYALQHAAYNIAFAPLQAKAFPVVDFR